MLKNTRVVKVERATGAEAPVQVWTQPADGGSPVSLPADRVVSTVSVGVLKRAINEKLPPSSRMTFSPALPRSHREALKALNMGRLEKLVLFFDTMFWQRTQLYADGGNEAMYFLGYVPASLGEAVKFQDIVFSNEQSSAIFFIGGDDVLRYFKGVVAGTSEFEALKVNIQTQAMAAITDIFANDERFLDPNGNPIEVEEPLTNHTLLTSWTNDPYFSGSYAYLNKKAGLCGVTQ